MADVVQSLYSDEVAWMVTYSDGISEDLCHDGHLTIDPSWLPIYNVVFDGSDCCMPEQKPHLKDHPYFIHINLSSFFSLVLPLFSLLLLL